MSFTKKTWVDRQVEYPGRRKLTPTGTADVYDVSREEGLEVAAGDALNAANLNNLENRIAGAIGNTANKSTLTTKTLSKTGWTGSEPPFTYSLSVSGVTSSSVQEILPTTDATEEQIVALQAANMQDSGQSAGKITVKAWGDKPEIDLPVRIIIRGDL